MAQSGEAIIQTHNLGKTYTGRRKKHVALHGLDLSIYKGEIFGYLGPNGAGKTTTIRILLDLIRPTTGQATLFGLDSQANSIEIRRRVGFLPGELNLWQNERSINIVRYFGRIHGKLDMSYVNELAARLEFDLTRKVREYSSGNKRKLGLILALMNRPDLLILDEPSSGLDPLMQQTFNQLMLEARAEGRTVFLSSHVLSEVQAICDRVGILRDGRLKAVERVDSLTHVDFRWVTLVLRDGANIGPRLAEVPGVSELRVDGQRVHLRLRGDFDPLLRAVGDRYVVDLRVKEPTLEEIVLAFYDDGQPTDEQLKNDAKERVS